MADLSQFNAILARLEAVADRLENAAGGSAAAGVARAAAGQLAEAAPAIALAFDAFKADKVAAIEAAAKDADVKDITEATADFLKACGMLRDILLATGKCKKPGDADWGKFFKPVLELGQAANKACDNRSDFFQHRKAAAEALNIVALATQASPPSHVQNVMESMDFHAIKVMQRKVDKETAWIKALKAGVLGLKEWCNDNCKLGLMWKPDGQDAVAYFEAAPLGSGGAGAAAAPKGKGKGKGPPVPAGRPAPVAAAEGAKPAAPAAGGAGMSAVFAALEGFSTSGLKKVTADMKTKNRPKDENAGYVPAAKAPAAKSAPSKGGRHTLGPKGEPRFELERDVNWIIENQQDRHDLEVPDATMSQLVVMLNCKNCTLRVTNKVKNINIDGCDRVGLICADVLSSVELVNSERCKVQTTGKVNSFAIDKCNGVNVWLSKESLAAEITSSKSSEMNVTIPDQDGDELDTIEIPIPEQFVTKVTGKKSIKTDVSGIYS
eukprot:TRINITY_DN5261_c0_g1_i1.p1 TRINITY_DN5261_c0_g1~~TRINITY_DN5261_c0_g1_i1.p1  ORF type:complete len:494 (+),score=187.10 TRINITY_DN5261_c0_g1_i1:199-1680(+)